MSSQPTPLVQRLRDLTVNRYVYKIAAKIGICAAALTHIVKLRRHPDVRTLGKILFAYPALQPEILAELRLRAQEATRARS